MKPVATPIRMAAALALALGVSACASMPNEATTRNAMMGAPQRAMPLALDVEKIKVDVPHTLKVSEANRFLPTGDIVWRGDPMGDRYQQVQAIFQTAMTRGTQGMKTGLPVELDIEVQRFHALTEKARYFTGGVHALTFTIVLRDPKTGQPLTAPRQIKADLKAYGGSAAIAADQRGETQKVRITDHLAKVIQEELSAPGSYHAENMGLMGLITKL